jgi:ACS family tartrate transporter-like MFS transporter
MGVAALASVDAGALASGLRKARWRLLPLLGIGYLVAYMDRANISFAAASMNRDLHFSTYVYGLGAGLFFVSYAACEIPSNALMLKFGARRWLARILVTWGLLAGAMMFVRTAHEFYGLRLVLGCAEAGYFPGVMYYLSTWFPGKERARAVALFYISAPLGGTVMGGLAGPLLALNGRLGLPGWQWLFLLEALPALVLGVWMWMALPEVPASATWLDEDEREAIESALDEDASGAHRGAKAVLATVLREPKVWALGVFMFCMLLIFYAVSFFLPTMLTELMGWTTGEAGRAIAVAGVLGAVSMVLNARHSDKSGERRWHTVIPMLMVGTVLLIAGVHLRGPVAGVALLSYMIWHSAMQGPMLAVATKVFPGKNTALAIATMNMCGISGGFVGPYVTGWMRGVTGGYAWGVGSLMVPAVIAAGCMVWVTRDRSRGASPAQVLVPAEDAVVCE